MNKRWLQVLCLLAPVFFWTAFFSSGEVTAASAPMPTSAAFKDCSDCPSMVTIPSGKYLMGSPETVAGPGGGLGPEHEITFAKPFALGQTELTRGQYAKFVADTKRPDPPKCFSFIGVSGNGRDFDWVEGRNWRNPGYAQTDNDPAVCLSWDDAKAYVTWLAKKTGKPYRLPSEAEWEYAARAGAKGENWLPGTLSDSCRYANVSDETFHNDYPKVTNFAPCNDGHSFTAPVASYQPNSFGLYDTVGNAWEWNEDCAHDSYDGAPVDGSAWVANGDCVKRVRRGGSWYRVGGYNRSALPGADWHGQGGVRVARDL